MEYVTHETRTRLYIGKARNKDESPLREMLFNITIIICASGALGLFAAILWRH